MPSPASIPIEGDAAWEIVDQISAKYTGGYHARRATSGLAGMKRIEGPIVQGADQAPVVSFIGPDGRLHSSIVRRPVMVRLSPGGHVRICYDPDDLARVFIDSPVDPSRYVAAMMGICGVFLTVVSVVVSVHRLV